jgi:plasmid replication initiation protein
MKTSELRKSYLDTVRNQLVVQSNDLVQRSILNLTAEEKRIIAFLVSKIRPEDTGFEDIPFSIREFTDICGVELASNRSMLEYVRTTLGKLAGKVISFTAVRTTLSGDLSVIRQINWFHRIDTSRSEDVGLAFVRFHDDLIPHLLQLRERFTAYQLRNVLAMNSKYSSRLYELLRSYEWLKEPISFYLEDLKELLSAKTYERFPDFRRKVLDIAMNEINDLPDLNVTYRVKKEGKRVAWVEFDVQLKTNLSEKYQVLINQEKRLSPEQVPGQLAFDDLGTNG